MLPGICERQCLILEIVLSDEPVSRIVYVLIIGDIELRVDIILY